jgi:hypothetical protein
MTNRIIYGEHAWTAPNAELRARREADLAAPFIAGQTMRNPRDVYAEECDARLNCLAAAWPRDLDEPFNEDEFTRAWQVVMRRQK